MVQSDSVKPLDSAALVDEYYQRLYRYTLSLLRDLGLALRLGAWQIVAIIATMIRLNCRKVVLETLFWIGCKSAHCLSWAFCGEFWSWPTSTLRRKALFSQTIFGEVLFSHSFFIHPQRKEISHERNSATPRQSCPEIITHRLT